MKKIISIILTCTMLMGVCFALASCSTSSDGTAETTTETSETNATASDVKVGFIYLHDENS